jgi:hypothetical protein
MTNFIVFAAAVKHLLTRMKGAIHRYVNVFFGTAGADKVVAPKT